jgi:hypothetical protein
MVARAGAGPAPVAYKNLSAEILAEQIMFALKPESQDRAKEMATQISKEDGNQKGAQSFHQFLPLEKMRCAIFPTKAAVWRVKRTKIYLSAAAAYTLFDKQLLTWDDLKLHRVQEYETDLGPTDPISGGATASLGILSSLGMGIADMPVETLKALGIGIDVIPGEKKEKEKEQDKDKDSPSHKRHGSQHFQFLHRNSSTASESARDLSSAKRQQNVSPTSAPITPIVSNTTTASSASFSRVTSPDTASLADTLHSTLTTSTEGDESILENTNSDSRSSVSTVRPAAASERTPSGQFLGTDSESMVSSPIEEYRGRSNTQNSMADALRAVSQRGASPWRKERNSFLSHSPSRSSSHRREDAIAAPSLLREHRVDPLDTIYGTGKGLGRIIGTGLKSPMDITLAISRGFHNMPRMYGEEVRQVDRVTGLSSGFKTAGKEFGIGIYDGVTGLVTQPVQGAKLEGVPGFFKGVGRGIAGLVLKPGAAGNALPAYAMLGVYKEIQKRFGENVSGYIIAARVAQGYAEWMGVGEDARKEVVRKFMQCLSEVRGHRGFASASKSEKQVNNDKMSAMSAWLSERREKRTVSKLQKHGYKTHEELAKGKSKKRTSYSGLSSAATSPLNEVPPARSLGAAESAHRPSILTIPESGEAHRQSLDGPQYVEPHSDDEDQELEEAVRLSLRAHELGHGLPSFSSTRSDITRARSPSNASADDPELEHAISASLKDHKLGHSGESQDDEALARAVRESMMSHESHQNVLQQHYALQRAPTESEPPSYSRSVTASTPTTLLSQQATRENDTQDADNEEGQLKLALEASRKTQQEEEERAKQEDEIVLRYVARHSLAEEELRRQRTGEGPSK